MSGRETEEREGEKDHSCIVLFDLCSTVKGNLCLRIQRFQTAFHADALHCSRKCSTCSFSPFCLSISLTHTNTHDHTHTHTQIIDPTKVGAIFNLGFHSVRPRVMQCSGRSLHTFPSTLTWPLQQHNNSRLR